MRCERHGEVPGYYCQLCAGLEQAEVDRREPARRAANHDSAFLQRGLARRYGKRYDPGGGRYDRWSIQTLHPLHTEEVDPVVDREPTFDPEAVDWSHRE